MAVKIYCNICDKFIKHTEQHEFQKLTGEEICEKCGKKVSKVYGELDDMANGFKAELTLLNNRMVKVYKALDAIYNKYNSDVKSFYTTRTAELDNRMKDVLSKED